MLVIGFGHRARQGKNIVARAIVQHCATRGLYAKEYGFADALKIYCRVAFGMHEKDPALLQFVGTDIFRKYNPDAWVTVLKDTLIEEHPDVALITDMRFPNEAALVKHFLGITVKVERVNGDGTPWVSSDRDANHASETALQAYTFDRSIKILSGNIPWLEAAGTALFDELYKTYMAK